MEPLRNPGSDPSKLNGDEPLPRAEHESGLPEILDVSYENKTPGEVDAPELIKSSDGIEIPEISNQAELVELPNGIGDQGYIDATENVDADSEVEAPEDETEHFETSDGIEDPVDVEDADEIKEEPDFETYPDYDKVKKEEPDDDRLDKTLPELGEINDMFDDVDGPEYVDPDYEGIAEVDGVDCFVCEG